MSNNAVFIQMGASHIAKSEREENDFYATDIRAIKHLYEKLPQLKQYKRIIEPCAGDGSMADQIEKYSSTKVDKYDIVSRREDIIQSNFFDNNIKNKYNLIITNPPYKIKDRQFNFSDLIIKALDDVSPDGFVCLFLKTLHLESQDRYNRIYKNAPPKYLFVYAPRISCYRNNNKNFKQGAISYTWFVWYKEKDGTYANVPPQLFWIDKL